MDAAAIVLTTWPSDRDPADLARALVGERLAACVNVLAGVRSTYRWQRAIEEADEYQLLVKTTTGRLGALEARLHELHPYDVPEFLVLSVAGGSEAYLRWVGESVASP